MQPYMLLQVLFDLSLDMLHFIRLKSALANAGTPLVDTLHKAQDEILAEALPICSKAVSAQPLGPFWFRKEIILTMHDAYPDVDSP